MPAVGGVTAIGDRNHKLLQFLEQRGPKCVHPMA
jgi:hypothetical protein